MTAGKTASPKAAAAPPQPPRPPHSKHKTTTMFKEPCQVIAIHSRPLFFCGLWFITVRLKNEYGWKFDRKAMFESKKAAESLKIGDYIIP